MKELSKKDSDRVNQQLKTVKPILERFTAVKHVGIGYAMTGGVMHDELSIIAYVDKKYPLEELNENEIIPKEINGINIDIMTYDPIQHTDPYSRFGQLCGGINIGNARLSGGGTLGCILQRNGTGVLVGLTNWHVIKNKRGNTNDAIVQPAWNSNTPEFSIGSLLNWDKALDCAIFTVHTRPIDTLNHINGMQGRILHIVAPHVGMAVMKSGARTGITYGIIQSIRGQEAVIVPNPNRPQRPDGEISIVGDSGSLWLRDDNSLSAVALHWGGSRTAHIAYANSMEAIAVKFGLTTI